MFHAHTAQGSLNDLNDQKISQMISFIKLFLAWAFPSLVSMQIPSPELPTGKGV